MVDLVVLKNRKGMTLINAVICMAIFFTLSAVVIQIVLNQKQAEEKFASLDLAGDTINRSIRSMYNTDFFDLIAYCSDKGALNTLRSGKCITDGSMLSLGSSLDKDIEFQLEQPLNKQGDIDTVDNRMCTEIYTCKILSGGHIVEVTLNQLWKTGSGSSPVLGLHRSFRKSRW